MGSTWRWRSTSTAWQCFWSLESQTEFADEGEDGGSEEEKHEKNSAPEHVGNP
jgi:hypothetical protein